MVDSIGSYSNGSNFLEIEDLEDLHLDTKVEESEEQLMEEELGKNVTHVILLLNHLFSKLEQNMTEEKKQELSRLKKNIYTNIDRSSSIYDTRALTYSFSAYLSFAASISTSLCPNADQNLLNQLNTILKAIESPFQSFTDGKIGKISTVNQVLQTEWAQKQEKANRNPFQQLENVVSEILQREMSMISK